MAKTAKTKGREGRAQAADRELRATPPQPGPPPQPDSDGNHDLDRPEYLLNRELTWLSFNFRVLHEAADERTPLLERLKFLSIVSSNLDEFFMKRIGGLKQQIGAGVRALSVDGRTPQQQVDACYLLIRQLDQQRRQILTDVLERLAGHGIVVTTYDRLAKNEQEELREHYLRSVFPLVTPQATDPAHPFPFVSNLSLNLLVTLRYPKAPRLSLARVKVPIGPWTPRFMRLQSGSTFVTLESVMAANLDLLFPEMEVESCELFRVTRNANTELDEDRAEDLLAVIESGLRERKFAPIVRLEVEHDMDPQHRGMLAAELGLDEGTDVFDVTGLLAIRDLMELARLELPGLRDPDHVPVDSARITENRNIFHVLRDTGTILVHHPYESFTTSVERFLRETSHDPKVLAVKMTIYRTSEDSKAIQYLIDAARNGKQVAVVVELRARFDEEANIRWANRLEEAGIHVTYGVVGLKTHCKAILVVRQDYNGLRRYAHLGTGNYHSGTARLYSDLGILTADEAIGADLTELFNYLTTGYKPRRSYRKLLVAPKGLKSALLDKIEREISLHTAKDPGRIVFKMNALEDVDVTRALYRAAQAGIRVELIVRDSCRFRPGVAGLSESATVISVVGRFLEHARVYWFRNGGHDEIFAGSADVMKRNLEDRVETLFPVEGQDARDEVMFFLEAQLADDRCAWEMRPDGSYVQREPADGHSGRCSQLVLAERAASRIREASRLRQRRPRGLRPRAPK